jgi:hypothetical protein
MAIPWRLPDLVQKFFQARAVHQGFLLFDFVVVTKDAVGMGLAQDE